MPNPADILSLQDDEDPEDQLRMQLDQGQGNNLAGAPQPPGQAGMPAQIPPPGAVMGGSPQPMAPSANVPGPLAALPRMTPRAKPHIKPKLRRLKSKPHIKLKANVNV